MIALAIGEISRMLRISGAGSGHRLAADLLRVANWQIPVEHLAARIVACATDPAQSATAQAAAANHGRR
jgi:hypothetical protein